MAEGSRKGITRREFIAGAAALGAAGVIGGFATPVFSLQKPAGTGKKSRVVLGYSDKIVASGGGVDRLMASELLDRSMTKLTGTKTADDAWKSLFDKNDVVGIKVNCAAGRALSTKPKVVDALITGLKRAGVAEENIIVWERTDRELVAAGFLLRKEGEGYRCYGTTPDVGFAAEAVKSGELQYKLSKIISERITALINVPILKDHGTSGITLALKNHYGSFEMTRDIVYKVHENNCSPYLAEVSALPAIRNKTRLVVMDAIHCCYDGGPAYAPGKQWYENAIVVSADPVAVDAVGTELIDKARKEHGLPSLEKAKRSPAKWLKAATDFRLGQHTADMIDRVVWQA